MEKVINPKKPVYLFNQENPKGKMLSLTEEQLKKMLEDGWHDTPAKLNLPKDDKVGVTVEQAEDARPEHLKKILEGIGFIVLTPEQLKAEANKMADVAFDPQNLTDEMLQEELKRRIGEDGFVSIELEFVHDNQIMAEAARRELIESPDSFETSEVQEHESAEPKEPSEEPENIGDLLNQFNEDPESLTIPELIVLGNTKFKLGLRTNMKEATLIEKINAALNDSE